MNKTEEQKNKKGLERVAAMIPARILVSVIGLSILIIVIVLLISMRITVTSFDELKQESLNYLRLSEAATELQEGSDQLTEHVRLYAVTGDRKYMEGYFEEANVTRQRDRAIETISQKAAGTKADEYLKEAMQYSLELMNREYYAMCLVMSAQGDEEARDDHPELKDVKLSEEDAALPPDNRMKKAVTIVMDDSYQQEKAKIQDRISLCLDDLLGGMFSAQEETTRELGGRLRRQMVLLVVLLAMFLIFVLFIYFSVFSPMRKAMEYIQENHVIPEEGGREFRHFAKALNEVYEENRKETGKLAFESTHDPVTGVYNRVGYEHLLESLDLSRAVFLLVDVDLFKQVNDTYGHDTGDRVLAEVASALLSNFRPQDHICRIGGDEFVVIAGNVRRDRADTVVRKIESINQTLREVEPDIGVSVSAGIAFGDQHADADEIFRKADTALYQVKRDGRGGAAIYHEGMQMESDPA